MHTLLLRLELVVEGDLRRAELARPGALDLSQQLHPTAQVRVHLQRGAFSSGLVFAHFGCHRGQEAADQCSRRSVEPLRVMLVLVILNANFTCGIPVSPKCR
eukprot:1184300-Prorocentrum_minimum.AAC.2